MRWIRVLLLGAALAGCGGGASGPGSQPGDAGSGPDAPETTITAPQAGATTTATVSVEFTAPGTGLHFECRLDAEAASACTSPKVYTSLSDGMHTVFVRAITASNAAGPEASRSFTVDASRPTVTVQGPPARDSVTRETGTALTFSADKPDSTITCGIDGAAPAPCTSPLVLSGLQDGMHTVIFQATSGTHVGPQLAWSWTVDTVAPGAAITGPVTEGHPVRERLPTLTGTSEAGAAVSIHVVADCGAPVVGTGTAAASGAFAVTLLAAEPAAPDGVTTYYARASDLAGNASCSGPFSYFTDNTPPAVAVQDLNTAATPSRDRRPTLTGTAEVAATVRVFRGAGCTGPSTGPVTSAGTWSIAIDAATEAAADGMTTYSAQATDEAGNAGCAEVAYFTDSTPPAVTVQSLNTVGTPSRDRRPTWTGTAEAAATVRVFRGAGCSGPSTAPVTSTGSWSIAIDAATEAAADGSTTYSAQATDAAGNVGCADVAYFTDSTPPAVTLPGLNTAGTPSRERRPTWSGTAEAGATVRVFRGAGCTGPSTAPVVSTGSWSIAIDAATEAARDGSTIYSAQASDAAGNAGCADVAYFTDNTPPAVAVPGLNTAGTPSRERRPTWSGTAEVAATVRVFRGAGCTGPSTATVISTGTWSIAIDAATEAAADGTTTYSAQASDAAGNAGCADVAYFTDNTPPAVTVQALNTPNTPSRDRRPTLTGTAEASATVRVFRSADCTGPSTAPVTSTGTWSIATDAATEANSDGITTYSAQAGDAAGNTGCAAVSYFTDNTAPAVAITAPVTDALHGLRSRRPVLSGTAETGATVQVFRGDACTGPATTTTTAAQGTWSIATDPTTDTPADGPTIYTARATDALGNAGCSAAFTYFSDNTPPETTITSPAVPTFTNDEQRTFTFSSNEPAAHFECALGTAAFAPCTSPQFPINAFLGALAFQVRAIDFAGNVDPSPASFTWTTTETPMIQYGFEGNAASTGALALDGTPDYTGTVQDADFVPGRFGKALAFRSSPSSKFVAPVKDVVRRAFRFNISFWFREDTVRASVGDAALFDNGVLRIFHATADSELTACLRTTCKTFAYSVGDWHQLRLDWSALELFVRIDNVEVTNIVDETFPFAGSGDIELGRGTNFMVDDLRVYDAELFQFLNGHPACQIFAFYDRNGNCGSGPSLRFGVEFEQSGDGATRFAPGRVDVYAAQLTGPRLTDTVTLGTSASYWLRVGASETASGDVFRTSGIIHSLIGTQQFLSFSGQNVALPALAVGWHHFLYSFEGSLSGTGTAKAFVDGQLVTQVATSSDPRTGTAMIGTGPTGPTAYIDSLREYGGSTDPQTICQLGPAGNWLFSTQTCGLADDLPAGLCVDGTAGSDTAAGDCAHPFKTITHALAAAAPGQAILVRPGTYDAAHGEVFPLVIGERTAVIGDEAQRGVAPGAPTRIVGCAADPAGEGDDVTVLLAGPRSSISGFDLSCPTRGRPVVVDADGAIVRRNHIAQAHVAVAHGVLRDTLLLGNELVDSDTAIQFSGEPRIEGNRITNNGIGLLQQDTSTLDAGGGPRGSRGGNQLYCNTMLDLSSGASTLRLRNNAWDEIPPLVATVPTGCIGLRTDVCLLTPGATLDTTGATLAPAPRCELN